MARRLCNPPSKSLLKKFIRSVAVRYGHTGMPWIVREDLLARYNVNKRIDPETAERVKHLLFLRKQKEREMANLAQPRKEPGPLPPEKGPVVPEETIKYPILDEFLPPSKQTDPAAWPVPRTFSTTSSVVAQGLFAELLEVWQFVHTFASNIEVTPMSLHCLLESLEYQRDPNPLFESICTGLVLQLERLLRTGKAREERIQQFLEDAGRKVQSRALETLPSPPSDDDRGSSLAEQEKENENGEEAEQELESFLATSTRSRKDSSHWASRVMEFLFEIRQVPEARQLLEQMKQSQQRLYELPGALKLRCLVLLHNFYATCASLRPLIDQQVQIIAEAKHRIRELESERRRV